MENSDGQDFYKSYRKPLANSSKPRKLPSEGRGQGFESLRARHSLGARHKFQTIGHMRSAAVPRKLRRAFDGSFIDRPQDIGLAWVTAAATLAYAAFPSASEF